ncbi:MAG TPA: cytochrome oxidase subunit III [Desulfobacteraceae bacterium]|nr:cytochrome oxidase subunit III [Desulfobacteraceae bacterium]
MAQHGDKLERTCQLWGWGLFIISALFFCWGSLKAGDMIGFLGAFFFLVACIVFLIPFVFNSPDHSKHQ